MNYVLEDIKHLGEMREFMETNKKRDYGVGEIIKANRDIWKECEKYHHQPFRITNIDQMARGIWPGKGRYRPDGTMMQFEINFI